MLLYVERRLHSLFNWYRQRLVRKFAIGTVGFVPSAAHFDSRMNVYDTTVADAVEKLLPSKGEDSAALHALVESVLGRTMESLPDTRRFVSNEYLKGNT